MKEPEMEIIGNLILRVLNNINDENIIKEVKNDVTELTGKFPLYKD